MRWFGQRPRQIHHSSNYRDTNIIVTRYHISRVAAVLPAVLLAACGNKTARAPNPTTYDWPDSLTYHVELAAESPRRDAPIRIERKRLSFVVRNDRYLVWNDSLARAGTPGDSTAARQRSWPEDTLHYYVRLSRLGEFDEVQADCDPVVAECRAALPSALPLEMRRIIPRLPVWWPPKGHEWVDTLAFDDLPRERGSRGSMITRYRSARDTVVGGLGYWKVTWISERRAVRELPSGAVIAVAPVVERGTAYVDKVRLIPACAVWSGTTEPAALPLIDESGGTALRGRAYVDGSACHSRGAMR
jgi:hypothetical protein